MRCAPPANKPTTQEIENCQPYLEAEMALLDRVQVIVALGGIAFDRVVRIYRARGVELPRLTFAHGAVYRLGAEGPHLVASYHPSRQNTQTGRLTAAMFAEVWQTAHDLLTPNA